MAGPGGATGLSAQDREAGRLLFAGACDFVLGAAALEQLPAGDRPEICFAGRSNVGKSSLINALTARKGLARASNTPGRTQQLNFFALSHPAVGGLYLVDLPGYGFAKAPIKEVERWQALLKAYLRGRATLKRCYLLIDARHGLKPVDAQIMDLLDEAAVSYQIVLTKADKLKPAPLQRIIEDTAQRIARRPAAFPEMLVTSAEKAEGLEDMRAAIARLVAESA